MPGRPHRYRRAAILTALLALSTGQAQAQPWQDLVQPI